MSAAVSALSAARLDAQREVRRARRVAAGAVTVAVVALGALGWSGYRSEPVESSHGPGNSSSAIVAGVAQAQSALVAGLEARLEVLLGERAISKAARPAYAARLAAWWELGHAMGPSIARGPGKNRSHDATSLARDPAGEHHGRISGPTLVCGPPAVP